MASKCNVPGEAIAIEWPYVCTKMDELLRRRIGESNMNTSCAKTSTRKSSHCKQFLMRTEVHVFFARIFAQISPKSNAINDFSNYFRKFSIVDPATQISASVDTEPKQSNVNRNQLFLYFEKKKWQTISNRILHTLISIGSKMNHFKCIFTQIKTTMRIYWTVEEFP